MIGWSTRKLRAFRNGLRVAWSDRSARWKIVVSLPLFVVTLVFARQVDAGLVLLATATVVGLELMNTAVERLANVVQLTYDERIGAVKDVAAAGVGFATFAWVAIVVGETANLLHR